MSLRALVWVLDHSEARLGQRLVLLGLAEYAHDDGSNAFPSVAMLARKARLSERATQTALRELERDGRICACGVSSFGTRIWRVIMHGGADSAGVQIPAEMVSDSAPDPSKTQHQLQGQHLRPVLGSRREGAEHAAPSRIDTATRELGHVHLLRGGQSA